MALKSTLLVDHVKVQNLWHLSVLGCFKNSLEEILYNFENS